jgi:transposase
MTVEARMKDTQLYEQLLGLSKPWSVEKVELVLEAGTVTVHVQCDKGTVWGDPEAPGERAHVHGWVRREWRHLDTCQLETRIVAEVPRVKYKSGRVEEVAVPWAERYSRITRMMEGFIVQLLVAASNVKRVANLLRLDWHTVNAVIKRAVERGMMRRAEEPVRYVGLDEKSFARHHNYASVLTDIGGSRVLDVVRGRSLHDAQELLGTLTPKQRQGVQAAAVDMWPGYMSAIRNMLGQADIVHDKFHVSKYLNDAVDKIRRTEHRKLRTQGESALTGTKYDWLKSIDDKRSAEAVAFRHLYQANFKTSRAWALKESFAAFWDYRYKKSAENYFDTWAQRAMRSRLEPMKDVAKMLRRHREGLLNYTTHRITNAAAEGFNSIIQTIKANARGFRSFENFRTRILFFCGKLDLRPVSVGSH